MGRDKKMGELHAKSEAGKNKTAVRKVGFYGCNDQVVRIELSEQPAKGKMYPLVVHLERCPGCTHEHDAQPLWREYKPALDDGKEAVIL